MSRHPSSSHFHKSKTLNDKYILGDEIGKGAYGRVYKGLDLENGDFVAIKQVSLENIPQEDLNIIMQEIDLLKNLNHKNIVKYRGSFKTKTHLYIILEYVENGSLASIIKPNKFGAFPESLVAVYIAQVLEGLVYLHEQGVIHRDIKGANILTTKEGLVKLADFGVATKLTEADLNTHSVVGTPYWMAPEVIEMSGVSAASDIWSVGCTVIELLTCVPPYYDLQPMPALFRIVQDEHPPIPEHLSPGITDFLHQCFRKDAKLRPDAKTLLMHPWIQNSRRALQSSLQRTGGRIRNIPQDVSTVVERTIEDGENERRPSAENIRRELFESAFEENTVAQSAINDISTNGSINGDSDRQGSPLTSPKLSTLSSTNTDSESDQVSAQEATLAIPEKLLMNSNSYLPGFPSEETPKCAAESLLITTSSNAKSRDEITICKKQDSPTSNGNLEMNVKVLSTERNHLSSHDYKAVDSYEQKAVESKLPKLAISSTSPSMLSKFSDTAADGSLDDLFEEPQEAKSAEPSTSATTPVSRMNLGSSNLSEYGKNDLAEKLRERMAQKQIDGRGERKNGNALFDLMLDVVKEDGIGISGLGFEGKMAGRDIFPIQAVEVSRLISLLKPEQSEDMVVSACQKLVAMFQDCPDQKIIFFSQHGLMPLMEMLEVANNRVINSVLQILNQLIKDNAAFQENACLIGLIPVIMKFAQPDNSREIRMQAAYFVQQLCQTSPLTLQMFIACGGLPVLVGFLEPDYAKYREMVHLAIDGMWQVFKLQSPTPRNDFCRISAKNGILIRLVNTLHNLNEATRLDSAAGGGATSSLTDGVTQQSRSGPLEPFRHALGYRDAAQPFSGQLDPAKVRSGPLDPHYMPTVTLEPSQMSISQSQRSDLSHFDSRYSPGQTEKSHSASGVLEPSLVTNSSEPAENVLSSMGKEPLLGLSKDHEQFDSGRQEPSRFDADTVRQHRGTLSAQRFSTDQSWKQIPRSSNGLAGTAQISSSQHESVQPLMSLLEKEPPSRHVSGQLEYIRYLSGGFERHESILPLLEHASAERKTNGELDYLMSAFAENGRDNGTVELSSKLSPKSNKKNGPPVSGNGTVAGEAIASTSGLASQTASGVLSGSGVLNARPGSATSSGILSQMVPILDAEVAREYLVKVADLLLEFSRADTTVKLSMCSPGLLVRLFQMLNKFESPILLKILKCINQLSTDPTCLDYLQRADAMKHLIPHLEHHDGHLVSQIHSEALNALYSLCKINKRRQEQAAENGIIPHLMHFIVTDSHLKQTSLPLLCDMAHASRYTREQLRMHNGLDVYLSLLDDEVWAVTALDSLAVCLAHDNDHRKVEQALLKKEAVQKLVTFFERCSEQSFVHILEPFLKIITKSARINTTLAVNGLTPLLVGRLDHQDAIARLNLLKLIKAVYEHHPRPKQLIVENALPLKLQSLIEERRDGERSGGQVLVKQMATALLKALHINTVL
ncbi:MAP3K epsilon protein kinase 1 isoform X2 [Cryptomeria japonica]|uniref:MAP3K epsilon protein kinase 1 isoform X2 n=1 Tax=Cryptomeria japonica TaxID=3369 RepID=UPI0027DA72DF|nr:MAP3K epsilon protein kinase 1 isoform X2 [Cryptomeria japonica]